jgi:alkanesulfonate monooxygenase SsuD/methylene tetrahydromethanopterin reductase-like flavin-dependent oxidoreductase (luciferase family)
MRRHVAFYASTPAYRPVLDVHGWGDIQPELSALSKAGAWDKLAKFVDDEMLDTFSIIATPQTVAGQVQARYGGLADRIMVTWWRKPWWPPVEAELRAL